jgi:uncharacterized protein (DUF1800 family)
MDNPTAPRTVGALVPFTGNLNRENAAHLLKRTLFGIKKSDIDAFADRPIEQVLDTLFEPKNTAATDLPLNNYTVGTANPDPAVPLGSTWVYDAEVGAITGARRSSLQAWWTGQMLRDQRSVHERLMIFWHNHFATESNNGPATQAYEYVELLYRHSLGNFKTFVRDITFNANMLRYLNGDRNSKTAPDENYARELQELFTLGKGPDSRYTEDDVKAAAKILTGWRTRRVVRPDDASKRYWETYFTPNIHDTSEKKFSSFFGGRTIKGNAAQNTEANARREIDELLDMIFAQREVAMHMARKLYRYFAYYKITPDVEANVIAPLADIFIINDWEIVPVVRALLGSQHFFSAEVKSCYIKSPLEYSVGIARELGMTISDKPEDLIPRYTAWRYLHNTGAATQGQNIGNPPSVAGWVAYYQEPGYHKNWINTDFLPKRLRFINNFLTVNGVNIGSNQKLIFNPITFTDQFGDEAANPNLLIDRVLEVLYRVPVSKTFRDYVKNVILLDNLNDDSYWTEAWTNYKSNPANMMFVNVVTTRLRKFYTFIVSNVEFQLS